ncbi:hypothetical protein B0I37DRAFT_202604 [Chaetomium sp. MPI-CAGE-AT-0009]|nr:hypothetical protein B0I37DRAFT_202604 [Chaetomium sp. MPI-CAGE-AT-0009]
MLFTCCTEMGVAGCFVLTAPSFWYEGRPAEAAVESYLAASRGTSRKGWIWTHLRVPVRSPFLFLPSYSAAALPWAVTGIGQRYRQFRILFKFLCAMRRRQRPCLGSGLARRMGCCRAPSPTPPRHEHLHHLCTSSALSRLRGVSVKAKPGERLVDFVPYPLGSGLFLTSMRGLQESTASPWSMWTPGEEEGGDIGAPPPVNRPGHSNRGPRTLHPEPAGRCPLAIQRSGSKQPAHIGHQRSRRRPQASH